MIIEAVGLTKYYGRVRGVDSLDLSVREGEVFGYLGPNGAGKTTTIRLFLDLIRPTRGTARLFGREVRGNAAELKNRIGNLPGELSLWDNLTGRELLTFTGSLRGGVDWTWVAEVAKRLDLDLSRQVRSLSHGNKQKVGLIQALAHKPALIILDEPTLGLDPLIQQEFYSLVDQLKAEGHTLFISSHVLHEVERVCDRVGIIREGRLVAVEQVTELRRKRLRQMEITFSAEVPAVEFNLAGVRDLVQSESTLRFLVEDVPGVLDSVIKAAAHHTVVNLNVAQATLEDVFLAYYRGEGDDAAA